MIAPDPHEVVDFVDWVRLEANATNVDRLTKRMRNALMGQPLPDAIAALAMIVSVTAMASAGGKLVLEEAEVVFAGVIELAERLHVKAVAIAERESA